MNKTHSGSILITTLSIGPNSEYRKGHTHCADTNFWESEEQVKIKTGKLDLKKERERETESRMVATRIGRKGAKGFCSSIR